MRLPLTLALLGPLALAPAAAAAAEPRWLASANTTMTASVQGSAPATCQDETDRGTGTAGSYRIEARTTQPIPVRKESPAPGFPRFVYMFFAASTEVRSTVSESWVEFQDPPDGVCTVVPASCERTTVRTWRPRYNGRTVRGRRMKVELGADMHAPLFIPYRACGGQHFFASRDGLLPGRFETSVAKRFPYSLFGRRRFKVRIAAKGYPVHVLDSDNRLIRGTGSFSMTISFRPYRR